MQFIIVMWHTKSVGFLSTHVHHPSLLLQPGENIKMKVSFNKYEAFQSLLSFETGERGYKNICEISLPQVWGLGSREAINLYDLKRKKHNNNNSKRGEGETKTVKEITKSTCCLFGLYHVFYGCCCYVLGLNNRRKQNMSNFATLALKNIKC